MTETSKIIQLYQKNKYEGTKLKLKCIYSIQTRGMIFYKSENMKNRNDKKKRVIELFKRPSDTIPPFFPSQLYLLFFNYY